MKVRIQIVAHLPDGTTEDDVRTVFHNAMDLYTKATAIHLILDNMLIAQGLLKNRDTLTMTKLTVLDDLAEIADA